MIYQPPFEQSDWSECYNHGRMKFSTPNNCPPYSNRISLYNNYMYIQRTCRSCIVDALSSCSSRCPDCNLPGWMKDLKSNRQLGNMIRLLSSMKKQVSPTVYTVSKCISDEHQSRTKVFDGASYDLSSEVECDENQHKYSDLFIKPRVEACLIKRHCKSSKMTEGMIPKLFPDEKESVSTITGSCLQSSTSSLMRALSNSSKRESIKNARIGIDHSSAEVQDFGLLKHRKQQSIHCESDVSSSACRVDKEFPCSTCISVTSNCAYGVRQCHQKSECVISTFPRNGVGQRFQKMSEGTCTCMCMYIYSDAHTEYD